MKIFLKVLLLIWAVLISHSTISQNPERFPALRERIINVKFDEICRRLELSGSQADKLRPVFRSFEKEKAALMLNNSNGELALPDSSLTEQQQDKIYLERLGKAKKMIELRETYYPKFRTVLTPRQVIHFNRLEMELNKRMLQQMRKRMNERNQFRE
jgi:uncharacterized protein (DUF1499 family)